MFISRPQHYDHNHSESRRVSAAPAQLTTPNGTTEPGVLIRSAQYIKFVLPASEALRIANQIADAVEKAEAA